MRRFTDHLRQKLNDLSFRAATARERQLADRQGLEALLQTNVDTAFQGLEMEPTGYLGLRDYQLHAIRAVEQTLLAQINDEIWGEGEQQSGI